VEHRGYVYSFGGYNGLANVAYAFKYDPIANAWSTIAPMPSARDGAAAVSDGTYIYILGGADANNYVTNTLYRYDPATNSYTTLAPFNDPRTDHAAAYLNGKIYRI